ncbi:MAG: hypothetical protein QM831_16905 [Kofleriaceae bacterium]
MRALLVVLLVGCGAHPYLNGGIEMGSKASGPISTMMQQPVASARPVTELTEGETAPVDTTPAIPRTYSVALGLAPARDLHVELGIHAHDISTDSLNMNGGTNPSYLASPRYLTGTSTIDLKWYFLRFHHVGTYIHVGPGVGAIIDKSNGSTTMGEALRFGGGVEVELPYVRVFLDASQTELLVTDGLAQGVNQLSGITLGVGLH